MAKDFYAILGVARSASDSDIKQAYRKLSRELHPDKHKGDKEKEARFKEVNEAYEVLSDPKKKQAYDQFGSADFAGGGAGFGGFDPSQFHDMGGLGDIFETFFGGQRSSGRRESGRGRTLEAQITITFQEAVQGAEKTIRLPRILTCDTCGGSGAAPGSGTTTCKECHGTGAVEKTVRSLFGMIRQSTICPTCRGAGKVPEKPCSTCRGEGRHEQTRNLEIRIPAGIDDGQSLRLQGEGEAGRGGEASGDLLIRVHVAADARFERDGDHIRTSLSLSVLDAILGAEATIETVHGQTTISIPAGTQPGTVLRLKGKGMPIVNTSRHGDHFVTLDIALPTKLKKEERKLYEELRNIAS